MTPGNDNLATTVRLAFDVRIEVSTNSRQPDRLGRCCSHHQNWAVLQEHLLAEFPTLDAATVTGELERARVAVEWFGLSRAERRRTAEMIVRNEMWLLTGPEVTDPVPSSHPPNTYRCDATQLSVR